MVSWVFLCLFLYFSRTEIASERWWQSEGDVLLIIAMRVAVCGDVDQLKLAGVCVPALWISDIEVKLKDTDLISGIHWENCSTTRTTTRTIIICRSFWWIHLLNIYNKFNVGSYFKFFMLWFSLRMNVFKPK